jgi:hypothetical protein
MDALGGKDMASDCIDQPPAVDWSGRPCEIKSITLKRLPRFPNSDYR